MKSKSGTDLKMIFNVRVTKAACLIVCGALVALVQGCAIPASPDNMIPVINNVQNGLPYSVIVDVDSSQANDHFRSRVSDEDVRRALKTALTMSGLFSSVTEFGDTDYSLKMEITSVDNFWGLTAKIGINTAWNLTDRRRRTDIWKDVVSSQGVATVGESFGGQARAALAYEKAIKENIRLGINLLSGEAIREIQTGSLSVLHK